MLCKKEKKKIKILFIFPPVKALGFRLSTHVSMVLCSNLTDSVVLCYPVLGPLVLHKLLPFLCLVLIAACRLECTLAVSGQQSSIMLQRLFRDLFQKHYCCVKRVSLNSDTHMLVIH